MRDVFEDDEAQWLTFTVAARRVDRSRRTIKRWHQQGMPVVQLDGTNYVRLDDLLAWWRTHLIAWPIGRRKDGTRAAWISRVERWQG